jgi:hypothetical protein
MQQVAIFVHFIRGKSFLPSPAFNHTQRFKIGKCHFSCCQQSRRFIIPDNVDKQVPKHQTDFFNAAREH